MKSDATTVDAYIASLPEERRGVVTRLRDLANAHIPAWFQECMNYGMIGRVVPHSIYPPGYHCDPKMPLPFFNIASQKNTINLYHIGLYGNPALYDRFVSQRPKHTSHKLDIGKSCIRFKKRDDIPYTLLGILLEKMTTKDIVALYENMRVAGAKKK